MTSLRIAVAAPATLAPWHEACLAALATVDGLTVVRRADTASVDVRPDVLLVLGAPDVAEGRAEAPAPVPAETWRFEFGPERSADPAAASLRRYVRGLHVMRAALVRSSDGAVLRSGLLEPGSYWAPRQLQQVLLAPSGWPAAVAADRIAGLADAPAEGPAAERTLHATAATRERPAGDAAGIRRSALVAGAIVRRLAGSAEGLVVHDNWNVGLVDVPIERFLEPGPLPSIRWLPPVPEHFAADPFGVERDGHLHVFYEDFDQRRGLGTIQHVSLGPDGAWTRPQLVIDAGVHASYPFLVEDGGRVYLVPETGSAGRLVLYEATDFPRGWRPAATLLPDVPVLDASLVRFEGRWWMFGTRLDRGSNHDLFLWHADDLRGPWREHAGNPVKSDVRSARPGGTPFVVDGVLHRPSQDDSGVYGGRLVINRIDVLSPTAFREEPVRVVSPDPARPDGLHTLSAAGQRTLVDGNDRGFVRSAFRRVGGRQAAAVRRRIVRR